MAKVEKRIINVNVKNIREFNLPYWEVDSGREGPCFLLTAALHGCEVIGCDAMRRFLPVAARDLVRGKILLLPFSNPPAVWNRRHNLYSSPSEPKGFGKDNINGAWPGKADGHEVEQIAFIINEKLVKESTHNIDMHCWSRFNVACAVPDDESKQVEFAMAAALPAVHVISRGPAAKREYYTLSGYFNATDRLSFSMEFSGQYMLSERESELGVRMLSNCSRYIGIFEGDPEGMDEPSIFFNDKTPRAEVKAPAGGLFVENGLKPGDIVARGDLLGILFMDDSLDTLEIKAPEPGMLYSYGCHRRMADVDLAAQHPYADKDDLLATIIATARRT